ncbi:MAG TPA: tetratricopeptide repeat protein [Dokdonella sp.]|uniref:O-linked N-acetylglucosamine transferase, SPINDLY family protein n=1 Tax=Dokdonella sp. TaxID=2291710 RepID=UPI002CE4B64D|nr:tetratricopeptide repeat protein [Dokdonella sp.]HUD43052.1 tetratricopeptide repeat protein [Dokdonella sp.]
MNASFSPVTNDPLSAIADRLEAGDAAGAEAQAAALRAAQPDSAEAARLHGIALLQLGRPGEALAALEYAVERAPASVAAQCNLGSVRIAAGRLDEAIEGLRVVLRQNPGHAAVLMTLGNALMAAGRYVEAQRSFATATYGAPRHPSILINLAAAELKLGHHAEAEACIRDAISVDSRNLAAYLLYGDVLIGQGRHREAATVYAHAQKLAPEAAAPAYQRGLALDALGELEDAAAAYGEAVARDPQLYPALSQWVFAKRRLCDWDDLDRLSARLVQGVRDGADGITPFAFLAEDAGADLQLRCARRFADGVEAEVGVRRAYLERPERSAPNTPLRVGFVSNGFGEHPTGLLTVALFEALASRPIEVHLFATGGGDGPIRRRLRAAAHRWHDVAGATPDALAQTIAAAGLDRLVDLRGWGEGGSGEALALRPAPVQIGWLAYPGTSGAPWIDYVIADAVVVPEAAQASFSERVAYLPRCFQPSDTARRVAAPPDRAACGLPETDVVLACFNNGYKLNPASFARMLTVLRDVPDAVLWLLSGPGLADARLREAARAGGVDPARLIFLPRLPHADYLTRFGHVDLFLDTAPYNAHTTASDAIWAGCPVLTLPGDTFASRVAASLNTHLGLTDLIAADEADFVRKAVAIASDPAARAALHTELAHRRESSGLFDMDAFADDFVRVLTDLTPPGDATSTLRQEASAS